MSEPFGGAFSYRPQAPRGRYRDPELTPEQEDSLIADLMRQSGGTVEVIGKAIDTPGALLRGALADQPDSGLNWDSGKRVSGEELLLHHGILQKDDHPWIRTGAGLAAEIALDPLAMVSGPLRALTAGGKAAKAAGILDKVSDLALARAGMDDAAKTITGAATSKWAKRLAEKGLPETTETFAIRPLIGQRAAQTRHTLDELVKYVDEANGNGEALKRVNEYLAPRGLRYEDVANEKLGGAFGLGYFSPMVTFTPPGSEKVLDAMDALGQKIAWSSPMRLGSAMFDKRVDGAIDAADQVAALKQFRYLDDAAREGRRVAARHAMTVSDINLSPEAQRVLGANTLLSPQGNDFLTRLFENQHTLSDQRLKSLVGPDLDKAIASWDAIRKHNIASGTRLGMDINPYSDEFGVLFSPRTAAEADFGEYGMGLNKSVANTRMLEQAARQEYLKVPGGTVALREASLLPKVDDFARNGPNSKYTLQEVGEEIKDFINAKYGVNAPDPRVVPPNGQYSIGQENGEAIASFFQRLDKRRPDGLPVFSEHPVSAQAKNIVGQHLARANAQYIYDSIAEAALDQARGRLKGGFKSADAALTDIAKATGLMMADNTTPHDIVVANLRQAIAKRIGGAADDIDLSKFSINEQVYNRLTRIQDFYSSPRAQQSLFEGLDKFTQLFKGFVLAWPSRFVRDMYSNVFSIMLENGSIPDTIYGLGTAKSILRGDFDSAIQYLKELPQYAGITDPAALRRQFIEDAAGSGILQSLASSDLVTSNRSGAISQLVPGASPITKMDAAKELGKGWGNFFQVKDIQFPWQKQSAYETLNPVLNASQKMGDYVDSVGRLGGYISLLRQGLSPEMAAKRITEALVDYSSLTTMERNFFRRAFPWWAYNSRIGKYVVNHLVTNPGGSFGQSIRALNTIQSNENSDVYLPAAIRQQFALRIPDELAKYLGANEEGGKMVLRNFDFPGVDVLAIPHLGHAFGESVHETLFNLLQQASPYIRGPAELAFDTDSFTRRPMKEAVTPLDRIYKKLTGSPQSMDPTLRTIINNFPGLQRPISLVGGMMDDRLPLAGRAVKQGFNTFSGTALQQIEPEWAANDISRGVAGKLRNFTRTVPNTFVPKELMPYVPAELMPYVLLDKSQKKKVRAIAKEKQKKREAAQKAAAK